MPPIYEWKCKAPQEGDPEGGGDPTPCNREHTVIRKHTEYNVPPDQCELCGNIDPARWEKFIGGAPGVHKSIMWRMKPGGKGNP